MTPLIRNPATRAFLNGLVAGLLLALVLFLLVTYLVTGQGIYLL